MTAESETLCCGCLCSGRRMIHIDEQRLKQRFLQLCDFSELEEEISLCWECNAQVHRFTRFTEQIKLSYNLFKDYIKQEKSRQNLQSKSKLSSHSLFNISVPNSNNSDTCKDVIKSENNVHTSSETLTREIKSENNVHSSTEALIKEIKSENNEHTSPSIKEEYGNCFLDTNSDDEILIQNSEKKTKVKKKKRKRKELAIYQEIKMSKEDLQEERRLAMLIEDYVNAMFRCERCIISFPNAEDLKDHISIKHELNVSHFKCDVCECSFSSEVSYNYHINKHSRRYQCVVCSERFNNKRGAAKHFEEIHCHGPAIEFSTKINELSNGTKMKEVEDRGTDCAVNISSASYPCEFCDKVFRWKTSLRKHVETHRIETGQKRKPYCEPCRLSFTTTSNLQKHVKTSSKHQIQLKLRKLTETLPEDSSNSAKLQVDLEQIRSAVNNSRQKYPCPQCDKKFQWRGNLLRHVNSHVARANGELVCEPCNRTFSSIATYNQHMKISKKHVSENDFEYMCSDCGKRFANKTRLKDHVDWEHLKNYVHKCSVCQKVFKSHTSLYLHKQVVHRKDSAEHLCDHCGKPFPSHAKLRSHITALHSGESAYKCATCGAGFSWHSCLSRHARKVHANRNKPAK